LNPSCIHLIIQAKQIICAIYVLNATGDKTEHIERHRLTRTVHSRGIDAGR
jgi:hypothetical protein